MWVKMVKDRLFERIHANSYEFRNFVQKNYEFVRKIAKNDEILRKFTNSYEIVRIRKKKAWLNGPVHPYIL